MNFLALTKGIIPVGTVLPYAGAAAPTGWLICNGVAVSRTTYADLFAVLAPTQTGNTTSGSNTITNLQNTQLMKVGAKITGTGIPASTTILSIDSGTAITISNNATATNTGVTLTYYPYGDGDGSTTFNPPDMRGKMALGLPTGGTGQGLGATGGNLDHTHAFTSGAPSNTTGASSGSGVQHATQTHTHSGTTGTSNPPYVSLYYIIKY